MFHRRRASSNPPKVAVRHTAPPPPTPSAASAAAQAFIKGQQSNGTLSAAAAAAALRSHATPPTAVANVQTKRMQRRNSNGSIGSSVSNARPGLERRGSAGSMTERSFRSPSPGRGSPSVRAAPDAPPVPLIPVQQSQVNRTSSARNRAASLEPPLRVSSPTSARQGGRGVSLDRAPRQPTSHAVAKTPRLSKLTELEREGSQRSSVNFSRPMSPQNGASPSSPTSPSAKNSGWFTGAVTSGQAPRMELEPIGSGLYVLPPSEVSGIQQAVQSVADKPMKKKKKKKITQAAAGSHFASGTMGLTGTAVQPAPEDPAISRPGVQTETENPRALADSSSETSPVDRPRPYSNRTLARQPSMVDETPELDDQAERANTGRKVDAPPKTPLDSSRYAKSVTPTKAPQPAESSVPRAASIDGGNQNTLGVAVRPESPGSHSPSRSAHFGATPPVNLLNGTKHHPPGRSVSPMKSALKYSPSSSVRTTSPEARFATGHVRSVSELTDISDQPGQKKARARVSFDDAPIVVTPGLETSRYASKSPPRVRGVEIDELGDAMKPMPVLPTFGSVRGRKRDEDSEVPASMSSSQSSTLVGLDHSNDHSVGGILAQDFADKQSSPPSTATTYEPLPPEVTSVEGTGYVSDSESNYSADGKTIAKPAIDTTKEQAEVRPEKEYNQSVPQIAISPATPAAEEVERQLNIPGAFPDYWSNEPASVAVVPSSHPSAVTAEPVTFAAPSALVPPVEEESSDSDNDSVYSDAAEDPSELYGGFASLDAIVESPITAPKAPGLAISTRGAQSPIEESQPSPTWNETTAYWRSLSEQRKKELEEKALQAVESSSEEEDEEEETAVPVELPRPVTPPQTKTKKLKPQAPPAAAVNFTPSPPTNKQPRSSAMKHTLRSSMDSDASDGTHLRSSMRNNGPMPSTMRGSNGGLAASKWSNASPTKQPKGALQKKNIPMAPASASHPATGPRTGSAGSKVPSTIAPTLRRTGSADSASSFKRNRASSPTRADGRVSMRRSMRDPSPNDPTTSSQAGRKSSRLSIRSLSPVGSTEPVHMRSSLRGSAGQGSPTLRPQKPEKKSRLKSPTRLGFGRSSKSRHVEAPSAPAPSKMTSRFATDSDDDEPRPTFVSRFADSDDEDDVDLPPVRGIPRKKGEEDADSTDLEGEDDSDERPALPSVPTLKDIESAHAAEPLTSGKNEGSALATGSLRDAAGALATSKHAPPPAELNKRRFSFLGVGKKRASSVPQQMSRPEIPRTASSESSRKPKLQRRTTPNANMLSLVPEDSWPLPAPPKIGGDGDRPNTSDGMPGPPVAERPDIGKRRSTAEPDMLNKEKRRVSFGQNADPVYSKTTGKKKKFGTLRRMFGLHD